MSALGAIFTRELRLAFAGGGGPAGPAAFNLAALALAPLAIGPDADTLQAAGPGVIAFAALLATLQRQWLKQTQLLLVILQVH